MPVVWLINDGVLYTSNNGFDKITTPIIPFSEFLEDCFCVSTFVEFNELVNDVVSKEINNFPQHMKDMAISDIKNAKRAFLENKQKEVKDKRMLSFIGNNGITIEDCKYILKQSEMLMPILLIQYKSDIDMICLKMKEYQKILREECLKQRKV